MTAIGSLVVSNGLIGLGPDARAAWEQTKGVSFACPQVAPSATDMVLLVSADSTCQSLGQWVQTALTTGPGSIPRPGNTGGGTLWTPGGAVVLVETDFQPDRGAKVVITNNPETIAQLAGATAANAPGGVATPRPGLYAIADAAASPDIYGVTLLASNIAQGKGKNALASLSGGKLLLGLGLAGAVFMVVSGGKKRRRR